MKKLYTQCNQNIIWKYFKLLNISTKSYSNTFHIKRKKSFKYISKK